MPNYSQLREGLTRKLKPVAEAPNADAAVALILKLENQDLRVLLVKRIVNPLDPWSGQMAFPGGKHDSKDQNVLETVVRETLEETNIELLDCCSFLGVLEVLRSSPRPEMTILPFVVLLEHEPSIKLSGELEEYLWVSLEELSQHRATVTFSLGKEPAYVIGDYTVWGLTYRILENFFSALHGQS